MILVTGAAGKTGRAVVRALVARGEQVRGLVRRAEQVGILREAGAAEVLVGNMLDPQTMVAAASDVRAVYHIPPNVHPEEVTMGEIAIGAARAAGVELLVYHSVLHPQTEDMPHHWLKLRVEERLFKSGLQHIILQPAPYMQNILAHWDRAVEEDEFPVPYSVEARLSIVDLEDVAEAAAIVLTQAGHAGATYELCGPEPLSQVEVAHILGQRLGRQIEPVAVPVSEWEQQARRAGLDEYQVQTLLSMFRYYDVHGLWGSPRVLGWLLGRPPVSFGDFVERTARERGEGGSGPWQSCA